MLISVQRLGFFLILFYRIDEMKNKKMKKIKRKKKMRRAKILR